MAVLYSIYRDKREDSNHFYYGRSVVLNTVNTQDLAKRVQANCSMKYSDVIAVIAELVEVMGIELQNSNAVHLDGFGTFKIGLNTTGAPTAKEFTADNVKRCKIKFLPEGKKSLATKKMVRTFLDNVKLKKFGEE